jgi:gliding-associated putative ABC transporter substrate-binding component GldG
MRKKGKQLKSFLWPLISLVLINILAYFIHTGLDLTKENRFTISSSTKELFKTVDEPITLTVYLKGDMPAGFKRLADAIEGLSTKFNSLSNGNFQIDFQRPGADMNDTLKTILFDSLQRLGINPTNVKAQVKQGEQTEETLLFPGAVLTGRGRQIGIDFLEGQSNLNGLESLNNAEALLEYKISKAVFKLKQDTMPLIGYLTGNAEPLDLRVYDLIEKVMKKDYAFRIVNIDSITHIPNIFSSIVIARPLKPFSTLQKIMIDQYVMRGGKVIWALDGLYASMDSLQRSNGSFIAFDLGLNLDDQLFRYGARINKDLVQDLECDKIPSVIGKVGDKPQIELLPWPYSPLLRSHGTSVISRNLDNVLSSFPQSIDTIHTAGIQSEIILNSSDYSRSLQTPAIVEWKSIKNEEDLKMFTKKEIPVGVLLTGKFKSLFANRLSIAEMDSLQKMQGMPFLQSCETENNMIILSDGDILMNSVSESDGPLAMGMNSYTRQQFANRDFVNNMLFYLTGGKDVMAARGKSFKLRLLDKGKVESERTFWQLINILVPLLITIIMAFLFPWLRRRKFAVVQ